MPRFFFELVDHVHDELEIDFSDVESARKEAVQLCADFLADRPEMLYDGGSLAVKVKDDTGKVRFELVVAAINDPTSH